MHDSTITKNAEETEELGEEFAKKLKPQDLVFLIGNLGSGKTTFVKGMAKGLGISTRIISPTFVLVRTHTSMNNGIDTMYHLDLYRLGSEEEVKKIDLKDYLDDKNGLVVIEWPEISQNLVDKKVWSITFENLENDNRKINISFE